MNSPKFFSQKSAAAIDFGLSKMLAFYHNKKKGAVHMTEREQLIRDLQMLGVKEGDAVLVH